MVIKSGTYIGNGAATQAITGVGFTPLHVTIIPQLDPSNRAFTPTRSDVDDVGDGFYYWSASGSFSYGNADMIRSFDADGFTVGDGTGFTNIYNVNLRVYGYVCIGL